jgi:hypothetical protein
VSDGLTDRFRGFAWLCSRDGDVDQGGGDAGMEPFQVGDLVEAEVRI